MAWYLDMYIENKDSRIVKPEPRFVKIKLKHNPEPWLEHRWRILRAHRGNNWVGNDAGVYVYTDYGDLTFYGKKDKPCMRFFNINYPDDCYSKDLKTGDGHYSSPYVGGLWLKCEWSNRTIITEEK
jgi:hypothetical protein